MKKLEIKNILIRLLYIIPLIIFVFILVTSINEFDKAIIYYFSIIPILIFGYQSIRNSIVGWIAVMILYVLYLIIWVSSLIAYYQNIPGKTSYTQYFSWWILIIIYIGIGLLYFKFRPKNRII
jgi:hypothetical protein